MGPAGLDTDRSAGTLAEGRPAEEVPRSLPHILHVEAVAFSVQPQESGSGGSAVELSFFL